MKCRVHYIDCCCDYHMEEVQLNIRPILKAFQQADEVVKEELFRALLRSYRTKKEEVEQLQQELEQVSDSFLKILEEGGVDL